MATSEAFTERGKGTYILLLHLPTPAHIQIGKLGGFDFTPGCYTYVGSAFGAGGLRGRLKHHLSPVRRPHWHIDYLRQYTPCKEVWYLASENAYEHAWATLLLALENATIPVPHFGASDCRCKTHLIYHPEHPNFESFCSVVKVPVRCWAAAQA